MKQLWFAAVAIHPDFGNTFVELPVPAFASSEIDKPSYSEAVALYVRDWQVTHAELHRNMLPEQRDILMDFCRATEHGIMGERGIHRTVMDFSSHWRAKEVQQATYRLHLEVYLTGSTWDAEDIYFPPSSDG